MFPEVLTLSSTMALSAEVLAKKLVPLLKQYLKARTERHLPPDVALEAVHAPTELHIDPQALEGLTPERLAKIEKQLRGQQVEGRLSSDKPLTPIQIGENESVFGGESASSESASSEEMASAKDFGAFVLAVSPKAVFQDARRRIGLVFKINLAVSIVLATILLGGIGGAVASAFLFKNTVWSLVFGGISAADVIGVYAFKPLSAINEALLGATRLDALQLRLSQQLSQCAQHQNLEDRIHCQTEVWEAIQRELAVIATTQAKTSAASAKKRTPKKGNLRPR